MTKKFGRKSLLLFGNSVILVSMVVYTIATAFLYAVPWFSYVSVLAAIGKNTVQLFLVKIFCLSTFMCFYIGGVITVLFMKL